MDSACFSPSRRISQYTGTYVHVFRPRIALRAAFPRSHFGCKTTSGVLSMLCLSLDKVDTSALTSDCPDRRSSPFGVPSSSSDHEQILNSAETMEERKARILEKATKLKNAREAARYRLFRR